LEERDTIATQPFIRGGKKHLTQDVETGYTVEEPMGKDSVFGHLPKSMRPTNKIPMTFQNKAVSESSSDDFLQWRGLEDDKLFTEVIDESMLKSKMVSKIEYAPSRLVMRVKFENKGSVVLYDHVPANVFFELKNSVILSGGKVGERFWDVVRIYTRPNLVRYGSKYPYTTLHYGYEPGMRRGATGVDYSSGKSQQYKPTVENGKVTVTGKAKRNRADIQALIDAQKSGILKRDGSISAMTKKELASLIGGESEATSSKPKKFSQMGAKKAPKNWLQGE